jgi:hypothetical protein
VNWQAEEKNAQATLADLTAFLAARLAEQPDSADVVSRRRILSEMIPIINDLDDIAGWEGQAAKNPLPTGEKYLTGTREPALYLLRLMALPSRGHEGYRDEWAI